jgi:hypothetical protein
MDDAKATATLLAGDVTWLSGPLEIELLREGVTVHRVAHAEELDAAGRSASNVSRAILQITPPAGRTHELRSFRTRVFAQLHGLIEVMPPGSHILILVHVSGATDSSTACVQFLEGAMMRLRAAAAQEYGSNVMLNAVLVSGGLDAVSVAQRVCEAIRARSFASTGFIVTDDEIGRQSINAVITEKCS